MFRQSVNIIVFNLLPCEITLCVKICDFISRGEAEVRITNSVAAMLVQNVTAGRRLHRVLSKYDHMIQSCGSGA